MAKKKVAGATLFSAASLATLEDSGLDLDFVQRCGIRELDTAETKRLMTLTGAGARYQAGITALLFPYFDLTGQMLDLEECCALRPNFTGFAASVKGQKYIRVGAMVRPYLPPFAAIKGEVQPFNWSNYAALAQHPQIITEGEKKALAAMQRGLPCLALAGVYNTGNPKKGQALAPYLREVLHKSETFVFFDKDAGCQVAKPAVQEAIERLSELILNCSGTPSIVVPKLPGSSSDDKLALDDWLLQQSEHATLGELMDSLSLSSYCLDSAKALLNEARQYYRLESGAVGSAKSRSVMLFHVYREIRNNSQPLIMRELFVNKDGEPIVKKRAVRLGDAYMNFPGASTLLGPTFDPTTLEPVSGEYFNTYRGLKAEPKIGERRTKSDVAIFFNYLEQFHGAEDAAIMANWYLWPLAHPGAKINMIPVLKTYNYGTGKSIMPARISKWCYGGELTATLTPADLKKFQASDVAGKLFVLLDDIRSESAMNSVSSTIDVIATADMLTYNIKYLKPYTAPNYANLIVTSNLERPMTDHENRRYYYPYCNPHAYPTQNGEPHPVFAKLSAWFENGGARDLVTYARTAHDFGKFNPMAHAPMNEQKKEMVELSTSPLELWTRSVTSGDLRENRNYVTVPEVHAKAMADLLKNATGGRAASSDLADEIMTRAQLQHAAAEGLKITPTRLSAALKSAGAIRRVINCVSAAGHRSTLTVYQIRPLLPGQDDSDKGIQALIESCPLFGPYAVAKLEAAKPKSKKYISTEK